MSTCNTLGVGWDGESRVTRPGLEDRVIMGWSESLSERICLNVVIGDDDWDR